MPPGGLDRLAKVKGVGQLAHGLLARPDRFRIGR